MRKTSAPAIALLAIVQIGFGAAVAASSSVVVLSPAPGVQISIPTGWNACDDANNALLGGGPVGTTAKTSMCGPASAPADGFRVFHLEPLRATSVVIANAKDGAFTQAELKRLAPSIPAIVRTSLCNDLTAPMIANKFSIGSCKVTVELLEGHFALAAVIDASAPNGLKVQNWVLEIPYDKGYLRLQFKHTVGISEDKRSEIDDVMSSIKIR